MDCVACQAPQSMGFSRQEYWIGLPCSLPDPGIEPMSLVSPALAIRFFTPSVTWEAPGRPYMPLRGELFLIPCSPDTLHSSLVAVMGHSGYLLSSAASQVGVCTQKRVWGGHSLLKLLFLFLAAPGLGCGMQDLQLLKVGSSSLTRDGSQTPSVGNMPSLSLWLTSGVPFLSF